MPQTESGSLTSERYASDRETLYRPFGDGIVVGAWVVHAATTNAAKMIQGIMLDGAEGDATARAQGLRLMHDFHAMLQPTPDEAKGGGGPVFSKFVSQKPREPQPD